MIKVYVNVGMAMKEGVRACHSSIRSYSAAAWDVLVRMQFMAHLLVLVGQLSAAGSVKGEVKVVMAL